MQKRQRRKDKKAAFRPLRSYSAHESGDGKSASWYSCNQTIARCLSFSLLLPAASHNELDLDEQQKGQKHIDGLKRKRPSKTSTPSAAASTSAVGHATLPSSDIVLAAFAPVERAVQNAVQPLVTQVAALQKEVGRFKHLLSDDESG